MNESSKFETMKWRMTVTFFPGQVLSEGVFLPSRPVIREGSISELKAITNKWASMMFHIQDLKVEMVNP